MIFSSLQPAWNRLFKIETKFEQTRNIQPEASKGITFQIQISQQ